MKLLKRYEAKIFLPLERKTKLFYNLTPVRMPHEIIKGKMISRIAGILVLSMSREHLLN